MTPGAATSEAGVATKSLAPRTLPAIKGGFARDAGVADVCASGAKNLGFESCAFSCVEDATLLTIYAVPDEK